MAAAGARLRIAIVICTYRRPDSLARALESIARAAPPLDADWQVVVVDNADLAATRDVALSFRGRLPILLVVEPVAGLSRARNTAVRSVDCDYYVWTDDDVTVDANWLRAYEGAFAAHPEAVFFGGPIIPKFEGEPPRWLLSCLPLVISAYAGLDLTGKVERFETRAGPKPFGANMALRAREQRQMPFRVDLGRRPGQLILSGEESELFRRICDASGLGIWVPGAKVTHWIDAGRQSIAYLRRYYEGQGFVHHGRRRRKHRGQPRTVTGIRLDLLREEAAYLWGRLTDRPETWVRALKDAAKLRGALAARRMTLDHGDAKQGRDR